MQLSTGALCALAQVNVRGYANSLHLNKNLVYIKYFWFFFTLRYSVLFHLIKKIIIS